MKHKKRRQLEKRWEKLPKHHINTEILKEVLQETRLGDVCSKYLNKVGYKYRGVLSISVVGEFCLVLYRDVKKRVDKQKSFEFLDNLIIRRKIEIKPSKFSVHKTA